MAAAYAAFLVVFLTHSAPDVTWLDSGELIAAAYTGGVPHGSGYALYVWLGKLCSLLPLGNIPARIVLLNVVCGATYSVALAYIASLPCRCGGQRSGRVSSLAAVSCVILWFCTRPVMLTESCVAENSMLFNLLLCGVAVALLSPFRHATARPRRIAVSLALLGLASSYVLPTLLLTLIPLMAISRRSRDGNLWPVRAGLASLLLFLAPLAGTAVRASQNPPVDAAEWLYAGGWPAAADQYLNIYTRFHSLPALVEKMGHARDINMGDYLGKFFPGVSAWIAAAMAVIGVCARLKITPLPVLFTVVAATIAALVRMLNRSPEADGHSLLFPSMVAVWACWGFTCLVNLRPLRAPEAKRRNGQWVLSVPLLLAAVALFTVSLVRPSVSYRKHRDTRSYFDRVFSELPPGSALFSRAGLSYFPLLVLQTVENRRPDVEILDTGLLALNWSRGSRDREQVLPPHGERLENVVRERVAQKPVFFTSIGWHVSSGPGLGLASTLDPGLERFDVFPKGMVFQIAPHGMAPRLAPLVLKRDWKADTDRWTREQWQWFFLDLALYSARTGSPENRARFLKLALEVDPDDELMKQTLESPNGVNLEY